MKLSKFINVLFPRRLPPAVPANQDSVGLFFYGPAPSAEQIAAVAHPAHASTRVDPGNRTRITIAWPDVTLTITIDPEWDKEYQLSGIRGWLGMFNASEEQREAAQKLSAELENTSTCYGSVTAPAFDQQGKAVELLKTLMVETGGCFFSRQTFYDPQGKRIIGRVGNPAILGTA